KNACSMWTWFITFSEKTARMPGFHCGKLTAMTPVHTGLQSMTAQSAWRRPATYLKVSRRPGRHCSRVIRKVKLVGFGCQGVLPCCNDLENGFAIVDSTAPRASADILQRCPNSRVVGQRRIRRKIGARGSLAQYARAFAGPHYRSIFADQIDASFQRFTVDDDFNHVSVADFANWTARQRFRRNMPDAGSGRNTTEPCVRDQRYLFTEGQIPQGAGDLVGLFH